VYICAYIAYIHIYCIHVYIHNTQTSATFHMYIHNIYTSTAVYTFTDITHKHPLPSIFTSITYTHPLSTHLQTQYTNIHYLPYVHPYHIYIHCIHIYRHNTQISTTFQQLCVSYPEKYAPPLTLQNSSRNAVIFWSTNPTPVKILIREIE